MKFLEQIRILIIDDEEAICKVLSASLEDDGYTVKVCHDAAQGVALINEYRPDVVLLDIWMQGSKDGLEVLRKAYSKSSKTQFIMMSGHGTIETAVKSTKLGAWDFVEKPVSYDRVQILIKNVLSFQKELEEKSNLLSRVRNSIGLVGSSEAIKRVKTFVARLAASSDFVLIAGEPGSGRELAAQNIHYLGKSAGQPYVEIDCKVSDDGQVQEFLFGHSTDAGQKKIGALQQLGTGTVYIDEISALSMVAQQRLLSFLVETKEIDFRIVASSEKDLKREVKEGRFSSELYYKLNSQVVQNPPLRDRLEDIPELVLHFSQQFCRQAGFRSKAFSEGALQLMGKYQWPGNVRELRNFVERVYILTPGDLIDSQDIRFAGINPPIEGSQIEFSMNFREARAKFEKEFLLQKISENMGNISKTAETIGLERSYLHRKIKTYGIEV